MSTITFHIGSFIMYEWRVKFFKY